jgi:hypothetical protein
MFLTPMNCPDIAPNKLTALHANAAGPDALPLDFLVADQGAHTPPHELTIRQRVGR